jgi:hypothetical protein
MPCSLEGRFPGEREFLPYTHLFIELYEPTQSGERHTTRRGSILSAPLSERCHHALHSALASGSLWRASVGSSMNGPSSSPRKVTARPVGEMQPYVGPR